MNALWKKGTGVLLYTAVQQSESVLCQLMSSHGDAESDHMLTEMYIKYVGRSLVDLSVVALKTISLVYKFNIKHC